MVMNPVSSSSSGGSDSSGSDDSRSGLYSFGNSGNSNGNSSSKDSNGQTGSTGYSDSSRSSKSKDEKPRSSKKTSGSSSGRSGQPLDPKSGRSGILGQRGKRVIWSILVLGFLFLSTSIRGLSNFYTDYLWFDSLDRTDVWSTVLLTKVMLFIVFFAVFLVLTWFNLMIADRFVPKTLHAGPAGEIIGRFQLAVSGKRQLWRLGISVLCSLLAVSGVVRQWEKWLLFINSKEFGVEDPLFGADISFYVFRLPFWSFVVDWVFAGFVLILIVVSITHFLNGGIRLQAAGMPEHFEPRLGLNNFGTSRMLPAVKVHLSALLAVIALLKAADYRLSQFELTVSTRGVVDGALYTDVKASLPALNFLIVVSLTAAVLLLINVFLRGWVLPVLSVGLWALVSLLLGNLYPTFIQRFQVDPNETARESLYTGRNIEATRSAYSLTPGSDVSLEVFDYDQQLTAEQIRNAPQTVGNARILDPVILTDTFDKEQGERDFYRFSPVLDVDRYEIDGEPTQVVLAARDLNLNELGSWERQHVAITHGYGLAMAPANATNVRGSPEFIIGGLPVQVDPSITLEFEEPQIYVGENLGGYALVGASRDEVDYVDGNGEDVSFRYTGDGGVKIGSLLRRVAFSLRFGQLDPLISNYIESDTKVIYIRNVRERLSRIAPFLKFDSDVYPVAYNGRIHYVADAYTTTRYYPYSQQADTSNLDFRADLSSSEANYIRNSVKAVVDSYTGDVTLYVMPVDDPIIEAWRSAFPELFTDFADMPEDLRKHLRFPTDLFTVQTNMWASYQVSNPEALIIGTERWAVAQDPGSSVVAGGTTEPIVDDESGMIRLRERRMTPYYSLIQLPDEDEASFVILRSFVPISDDDSRKELTAFMVGETRPDGTSRLVSYEMSNLQAPGPAIVASNISTNPEISRELTLLNDQGSSIQFGDLLLLPIESSLLYIRPLYVKAQGTQIPLLAGVIASVDDRTALGSNVEDALNQLYPGEGFSGTTMPSSSTEDSTTGDSGATDGDVDDSDTDSTAGSDISDDGGDDSTSDAGTVEPSEPGITDSQTDDEDWLTRLQDLRGREPGKAAELEELIAQLLDLLAQPEVSEESEFEAPGDVTVNDPEAAEGESESDQEEIEASES
ncbi:MAG: UPF0182 family protein [Acidimicrobiaceae bacterium]|nr:UPF0182 family protein [Acidimicrobiaceae bacterium]